MRRPSYPQFGVQHADLQRLVRNAPDCRTADAPRESACKRTSFWSVSGRDSSFVGDRTRNVLQSGTVWGTFPSRSRSGVAGLLPLRHLGSTEPFAPGWTHEPWPSTAPSNTRSTPRTG